MNATEKERIKRLKAEINRLEVEAEKELKDLVNEKLWKELIQDYFPVIDLNIKIDDHVYYTGRAQYSFSEGGACIDCDDEISIKGIKSKWLTDHINNDDYLREEIRERAYNSKEVRALSKLADKFDVLIIKWSKERNLDEDRVRDMITPLIEDNEQVHY